MSIEKKKSQQLHQHNQKNTPSSPKKQKSQPTANASNVSKAPNPPNHLTDTLIGATTTENVQRFGHAAAEYIKGYQGNVTETGEILQKGLKQVSQSKVHPDYQYQNLKQQAGFSAEIHYVNQKNAESIINQQDQRFSRSNDVGLGNHSLYDILAVDQEGNPILQQNEPLWSAQMKFIGRYESQEEIEKSAQGLVKKLTSKKWDKYRGNKVLVPSEQYELAQKAAQAEAQNLQRQAQHLRQQGHLEKAQHLEKEAQKYQQVAEDITDSGISSQEAMFLREHPKLATFKYVAKTAHQSGLEQAKAGAVISSAISTSRNVVCVLRGEKEIKHALKDVAIDTAAGSGTAYIIGASDTAIRGLMASSGRSVFVNLSRTNLPAMIATATVQVGKSLYRYANGEINALQLAEELGEKGTGMMAASWGAAIGTVILPGIGTTVGAMVGYMTSSMLYSASLQILQEEKLSAQRRQKIHAIATAAIESMTQQGQELNKQINQFYQNRQALFQESFTIIDEAIESANLDQFTLGLNKIALEMGQTLQFKNFNDFDNFMQDKSKALDF
ncbi:hypothetical protein [Heliorestis convoluta]|uniref:Uncharacterized protein n=1 Tax=Heliorestis convoluta TaxID=356322 RepID=A0A5Q2N2T6_9FIRM|nr:hypothetical protein [Heliorestis convoluta]QGG46640.1 hypothetical protein FTV88_0461 [Heliorestis convoluta]